MVINGPNLSQVLLTLCMTGPTKKVKRDDRLPFCVIAAGALYVDVSNLDESTFMKKIFS